MANTKRTRKDDVLDFIVDFAQENNGITPSTRDIATGMSLSQSRISYLLKCLHDDRLIEWVGREKYMVVDSEWEFKLSARVD